MPRPRLTLEKQYGQLTVIEVPDHGLKVKVRCKCGTEKWVLRSNLTSHRISSCGSPWCRTGQRGNPSAMSADAKKSLRLPSWLPRSEVVRTYDQIENGARVLVVAQHFGIHIQTLYNWLRVVKAAGGPQEYLAAIANHDEDPLAKNPTFVPRVVEAGVLPAAPPALYLPPKA